LAARIGIHRRSVQEWETGATYPSPERLEVLLRVLFEAEGLTPGQEVAQARVLWTAVQRDAPQAHAPFDPAWFATLLTRRAEPVPLFDTVSADRGSPSLQVGGQLLERRQDWGEAPDVAAFLGRSEELQTLLRWTLDDHCRLLSLLGMGGIGKTSLAARLAYQVAPGFERVHWRNLRDAPFASDWLAGAIGFLSDQEVVPPESEAMRTAALLQLLRQRRCLVVLDNFETLFEPGRAEGRYREGFAGYSRILQMVAQGTHQSCVLLTSREAPPELATLAGNAVRTLHLGGFNADEAQTLLADKQLSGSSDQWRQLTIRFGGNGLALKLVGETIRELFAGDLAGFLEESGASSMFGDMRRLLGNQIDRCSAPERQVLRALAVEREPLPLRQLLSFTGGRMDQATALEAVEALRRRLLIDHKLGIVDDDPPRVILSKSNG
jgi:hypothetical protein